MHRSLLSTHSSPITRPPPTSYRIWKISAFAFYRDQNLVGNKIDGNDVIANPDLSYGQYGFSVGGPIIRDKLFYFTSIKYAASESPGDPGMGVDFTNASTRLMRRFCSERVRLTESLEVSPFRLVKLKYENRPGR